MKTRSLSHFYVVSILIRDILNQTINAEVYTIYRHVYMKFGSKQKAVMKLDGASSQRATKHHRKIHS